MPPVSILTVLAQAAVVNGGEMGIKWLDIAPRHRQLLLCAIREVGGYVLCTDMLGVYVQVSYAIYVLVWGFGMLSSFCLLIQSGSISFHARGGAVVPRAHECSWVYPHLESREYFLGWWH